MQTSLPSGDLLRLVDAADRAERRLVAQERMLSALVAVPPVTPSVAPFGTTAAVLLGAALLILL